MTADSAKAETLWRRWAASPPAAWSAAILGAIVYLAQGIYYAHAQASVMDEGLYLFKGLLFTENVYRPFQDFGPLTNHMPLSFLIPGAIQQLFGPGLRTGRYAALVFGALMMAGLWLAARRLGGRWWAAAAVWSVALNPMLVKMYSVSVSQVLVMAFFTWALALAFDDRRRPWAAVLAAALAALIFMTRLNMAPVLPLLLGYLFWRDGLKTGLGATAAAALIVLAVHASFWPDILRLWAVWLPERLTPFLDRWRVVSDAAPYWDPQPTLWTRFISFLQGFRFHFIGLTAAMLAWLGWPRREAWKREEAFRSAVLLSALFATLYLFHAWASLGLDYCVFCFRRYLAFFSPIGFLILIPAGPYLKEALASGRRRKAALTAQFLLAAGLIFEILGPLDSDRARLFDTVNHWLAVKVPRLRSLRIMPGETELWRILVNKLGVDRETIVVSIVVDIIPNLLRGLVAILAAISIVFILWQIARWLERRRTITRRQVASTSLALFLAAGALLSPTSLLGGGYQSYDCAPDVLAAYEAAGEALAAQIPPDATVFWKGGLSPVPLLYLPDAQIYPAQLNGDYTFRLGGDPLAINRFGLWNEALAERWLEESDYILIEGRFLLRYLSAGDEVPPEEAFYREWLTQALRSGRYEELEPTPPTQPCRADSRIHIIRRAP